MPSAEHQYCSRQREEGPDLGWGFQQMPPLLCAQGALIGNILKSTTKTNTLFNFSVLEVLSILLIAAVNSGF